MQTAEELVTAELTARATGLNRYFLYRLASRGQIPCYRAGRAIRFSIPEVLTWMKDQATATAKANGHGDHHDGE